MNLSIVILAAGMGKRMQSDRPKVLHEIAGKPMLAHILDTAKQLNPTRITVVVGHGADEVKSAFQAQTDLSFALQSPQHGTAHAVMQTEPLLIDETPQDVTLVLYGDVPLVQLNTLQSLIKVAGQGVAILTETVEDSSGYGRILRDAENKVIGIVEHKDATDTQLAIKEINTGILCAPTKQLKQWLHRIDNNNAQAEYYLTDMIALAVADGVPINTAQPSTAWETLGVNSRIQQAQLERAWQLEQANRLLLKGVTLTDPARFDVRGHLKCGRDVFIDVGCLFEGEVVLADGVHIGPYCVLRNVQLGQNTRVEAFSHLEQAQAGAANIIGPYARLRPGAILEHDCHVGNFVELKKTHLGAYSKANHLSYLGDAKIGEHVNIGAGTITCNYDGVNKSHTLIEDDAFIGSGTQLIAPITVGKGATLGAGTTLRKNAPAHQLTITQAPQKTIAGWQRPSKKT